VACCCEHGNEPSGYIKCEEFFFLRTLPQERCSSIFKVFFHRGLALPTLSLSFRVSHYSLCVSLLHPMHCPAISS